MTAFLAVFSVVVSTVLVALNSSIPLPIRIAVVIASTVILALAFVEVLT